MVGRAVVIYYAASWPRLGRLVDGSWQAWLIPGSTWGATSAPVRMVTHAVIPPITQTPAVISIASEKPGPSGSPGPARIPAATGSTATARSPGTREMGLVTPDAVPA